MNLRKKVLYSKVKVIIISNSRRRWEAVTSMFIQRELAVGASQ